METLGEKIRKLRLGANMSKLELAHAMNVTPHRVALWESGQSFPRDTHRLAEVLGVTPDDLPPYISHSMRNTAKAMASTLSDQELILLYHYRYLEQRRKKSVDRLANMLYRGQIDDNLALQRDYWKDKWRA